MTDIQLPQYSEVVRRNILLEPLGGPKDVFYYLDTFPDEIYTKSPDSHLYKFMRALLGESGVNWLKKGYLETRIQLEEIGLESFDLDKFFGSPFAFGRIVEEQLGEDPYGIIPKDQWEQIKAKNARYRNRALDYMNGARAGNTVEGMRLVAKAGLGHDVEIVENYRFLFDVHSDDPLGLTHFGKTLSTEEMIVLPRREIGMNEQQMISISGNPNPPNGGGFYFIYNGRASFMYPHPDRLAVGNTTPGYDVTTPSGTTSYTTVPFDGTRDHVRLALECIPDIPVGSVNVEGGPGPLLPWIITFQGALAQRDVPELQLVSTLGLFGNPADPATRNSTNPVTVTVTTLQGGHESINEVVDLAPNEAHNLMSAVDRIRPQTTIMTIGQAPGLRERTVWQQADSSSEFVEVVRFVSGNPNISWPKTTLTNPQYWIEPYKEKQAPRVAGDLQYHYTGFHNITSVEASSTIDLNQSPDRILADYAEPLFITATTEIANKAVSLINGVYPQDYKDLPGSPRIRYKDEQFWASKNWNIQGFLRGQEQDEWVTIRFPFVKCVNYVSLDIFRDDVQIDIEYDAYDGVSDSLWVPVTPVDPYSNVIVRHLSTTENSWASLGLTFTNSRNDLIWTRGLKFTFKHLDSSPGHWGYPIKVRNLRVARNVS